MRCPDCNKFVSMDLGEPEVESIDIDVDGTVTASVLISRNCSDCGTTLKQGSLELTWTPSDGAAKLLSDHLERHSTDKSDPADDTPACEGSLEVQDKGADAVEGGTYKKPTFGATVDFDVTCSGDSEFVVSGVLEGFLSASDLEEVS